MTRWHVAILLSAADELTHAFYMACSAVPSAPLLAALKAKLIEDFG